MSSDAKATRALKGQPGHPAQPSNRLTLINGSASFSINVSSNLTGMAGTNPLAINSPVQFGSLVQFARTRTSQIALQTRATVAHCLAEGLHPSTREGAENVFIDIAPTEFGGIARIMPDRDAIAGGPMCTIRLPAGVSIATALSGVAIATNDAIDLTIINDTPKSAQIQLADPANDSMTPLDDSGSIFIAAHSRASVSCVFICAAETRVRAMFIVECRAPPLEVPSCMVVRANSAAFPPIGDAESLYVAADTNKLYRYQSGVRPAGYDWIVGPSGDFPDLSAALASENVLDGHKLFVLNGFYSIAATLAITKQVQIYGQSRADVIIATPGAVADPANVIAIAADNVVLRNLTIRHQKVAASAIESAILVSAPFRVEGQGGAERDEVPVPSGKRQLSRPSETGVVRGLIIEGCTIEYVKHAIAMRATNWKIANSTISYIGANTTTKRAIYIYATAGTGFITGNRFVNNSAAGAFRNIVLSGSVGTDAHMGTLVIEDNVHMGLQTIFFIQETFIGMPQGLNILFKRNRADETTAFATFCCSMVNGGNILGQITSVGNIMSNAAGKCALTLETTGAFAFRGQPLPIHVFNNFIASQTIGAAYALAPGASNYSCVVSTMTNPAPIVAQDATIPTTPLAPASPSIWATVAGYWELSVAPATHSETFTILSPDDLVSVVLKHRAQPDSITMCKNRLPLYRGIDYSLSVASGSLATRITWIGSLAPAIGDLVNVHYLADS